MKKKYFLIICFSILALLCSIGGAVWFSPITIPPLSGNPNQLSVYTLKIQGTPVVSSCYAGEKISSEGTTVSGVVVQYSNDSDTSTISKGTWTVEKVSASSTSESIENQTVKLTFSTETPAPDGYLALPISTSITTTLLPVAKFGDTYYSTIDGALAAANASPGTVYSLPLGYEVDTLRAKSAKTIETTTEIKSGVTLALPYATDAMDTTLAFVTTSSTAYRKSSFGNSIYLNNQLYVADGLQISNAGTINIAGEVSGGSAEMHRSEPESANSVTAGRHGQINLGASSILTNTGTITCYGFINETSKDNGSEFIAESGAVTVVFSVVEHRGGSAYFGLIDPGNATVRKKIGEAAVKGIDPNVGTYDYDSLQTPPFNRFFIATITAKTTVNYNANVKALANLYANGEDNDIIVDVISSSTALITLQKESSYLVSKYDYSTRKMDLDIYGDMQLNPMGLTLKVTKTASSITVNMNVTLATTSVFFPISDYFDVSLNPTVDENNNVVATTVDATKQKFKLLPGSKLTVNEGVTLNASSIAVYANNDLFKNGYDNHYTTQTPALFMMNGILNVANIGGSIDTSNENAVLNITESNSVISKEIRGVITGQSIKIPVTVLFITYNVSMGYTGIEYFTNKESTLTAQGDTVALDDTILPKGEYNVLNGKWYSKTKVISYNANGGTFATAPNTIEHTVDGGYTIQESDLPTVTPTREHYTFDGWTLNGEDPVGQVTYVNADLWANWKPKEPYYNINYVITSEFVDTTGITSTPTNPNPTEYHADFFERLVAPTWEEFKFDGWYLDEALTQKITAIDGEALLEGVSEEDATANPLTLYGAWLDKNAVIYNITYVLNNDDDEVANTPLEESVASTKADTYAPPSFYNPVDKTKTLNETTTYPKQFLGWYIIDEATGEEVLFDKAQHLTSDITLYASWALKYHFILYPSEGDPTSSSQKVTGKDVYLMESQFPTEINGYLTELKSTLTADNTNTGIANYFDGWTTVSGDATKKVETIATTNFVTFDNAELNPYNCLTLNLYALWPKKGTVEIIANQGSSGDYPTFTITYVQNGSSTDISHNLKVESKTYELYLLPDSTLSITNLKNTSTSSPPPTVNNVKIESGKTYSYTIIGTDKSNTCLAAGTLITLADGSKKAVEDLRKGNMVMSFDHLTGQIVYRQVIIVVRTQSAYYKNTFVFDDGTKLATINEHGIFDLNLNKYVNISHENYHEFIGHDFVAIDTQGNITTKKLVNVVSEYHDDGYKYDIVSEGTLNYVAEDTLSVTHVLVDIINTFDFGDNLVYDSAKMQADIAFYGLYTYDEWEEYCGISVFDEYNIPIMKIGVEKGLYTKDYIISLINQFVLNENNQIV
ncbi:MAG: InlB B-repeat-containing protein [Clostridia bacterium]|nr:InlB B-repeat-containing protein [Clostridia bacterium]